MGADMKNASSDAWKREGFYVRLSKGGKSGLAKLAERLTGNSTPTASVDRAIELALESLEVSESAEEVAALASARSDEGRFASIESAIEKLSVELYFDIGRLRGRIDAMAESV